MRGTARTWRHGRLCAAGSSAVVTLVTLLAGLGVVPAGSSTASAASLSHATPDPSADTPSASRPSPSRPAASSSPSPSSSARPSTSDRRSSSSSEPAPATPSRRATDGAAAVALPPASGTGKRVVFDISEQRVWLVDATAGRDAVRRTYLVSGSLTDNLDPGTFAVYSRSRWAVGIGDSGVMQYFVRFTRGDNAAIGFHSIPTKDGRPLQSRSQLGTPQSHGCIRQVLADAHRLYDFAPEGTTVVVTA